MTYEKRPMERPERDDLAELQRCKGRAEWCEFPPGHHEALDAAEHEWARDTNRPLVTAFDAK